MGHHHTHSPIKQDRPGWRWHGAGVYALTHTEGAAQHVAKAKAREDEKRRLKLMRKLDTFPVHAKGGVVPAGQFRRKAA